MATRALLDLRLLTRPNGASLASWYAAWRYTWPRDSAFTAAAFTMTGHTAEARHILGFLADVQHKDGRWAARYHADGTAVTDGREPQLDSLGWVLWASWLYRTQTSGDGEGLWRMVVRAADHLADSLGDDGLPPPSSDYWERKPETEQDPHRTT
ncbi:glycoside hydrolase family 15, partial [Actinomadura adrarensis]